MVGLAAYVRRTSAPAVRTVESVPAQPAALVLGAQVYPDGRPCRLLRRRLDLAESLLRVGKIEMILVSGERSPGYDEPGAMRQYLIDAGVPHERITIDPAGFDTYASCARARDVFGLDRLIVVSQTFHLSRALTICRALGITAYGVGDDASQTSRWSWRRGRRREWMANLKMVWDLTTRG